jgi:type II secretion system (T2SS) protein G
MILRSLTALLLLPSFALAQQEGNLADSLPANTLVYFEIPNVPALRDGLQSGAMGRIWQDEEVQGFLGGLVEQGMGQYSQSLEMMAEQGMPVQFMSWDAMQRIELGISIDGAGLPEAPSMMVALQITFADGLAEQAFLMISGLISSEGPVDISTGENGSIMKMAAAQPGMPAIELTRTGNRLRFTATNTSAATTSLASSASFQRARAQVLKPGMACFGYYNPRAGVEMQRSFLNFGNGDAQVESMAEAMSAFAESAVGNAEAVAFSSGWKDGMSVGATFVDFGGKPAGWAYSATPADRAMVQYVPADSTSFSIASMGGTEGLSEFLTSVDGVLADDAMAKNVAIWAEAEPISHSWFIGENRPLLDSALNGFGERVFSYSSPTRGSRTLIELTDPAAIQAAASPLVKTIAQLLDSVEGMPVALRAKRESPRSDPQTTVPVYYLRLKPEALPPEFAQVSMFIGTIEPAFAISPDGWLVIGMNRSDVRAIVRSGLQPEANNISSNEEAKSFLDRAPDAAIRLAWSDPRPAVTATMGMVQAATGLIGMQMDPSMLPVDLTKMPSANAFNRHLRPSESFSWRDEDGMKSWSSGSFGMGDFFGTVGYALPTAAMSMMIFAPMMNEVGAMEMVPAPPEHVDSDPVSRTHAELARLQTGIIIYQILNDQYPANLDQLLESSEDGQPYIDAPQAGLRNDGWGNGFIYHPTGNEFMLYSVGPNGQDEGGQGDDVTVEG